MKKLLNSVHLIFIIVFFSACNTDEINSEKDFKIEFGSECGWCGGQEFIIVTSAEIVYNRNIPCGEGKGKIVKTRSLNTEEWNTITTSFDYSLYKTLDYNECNVCVDGCDEIIRITGNNKIHELRYSADDKIAGIQDLRNVLTGFLEEMREAN